MDQKETIDPLADVLFWTTTTDPETHKWPFAHPWNPIIILLTYLALVLYILPTFMKNKKPYTLKNVILAYNVGHVLLSIFVVYKTLSPGIPIMDLFSPVCHHQINPDPEHLRLIATGDWWYVFAKILELPDTIFFILRKKNNQVSFLHVYHHSSTFFLSWYYFITATEDNHQFPTCLNSFIHVIMYTYYALAAMGPEYKKYIWWKKYITVMQLIQFFMVLFYMTWGYYLSKCTYTFSIANLMIADLLIMIVMFNKFYKKTYYHEKNS